MKRNPSDIIAALGGPTKAARALGLSIGTVDAWQRRGRIPAWRWPAIDAALAEAAAQLEAMRRG
jgi:DNA-binding transcriptional regulator YdaS (Cro superfamily)